MFLQSPYATLSVMFDKFWQLFSHDIGIDLGTVNTLVLVKNKGIVIREPSVVAIHRKSKQVLAIGSEAKRMLGRTPQAIEAVRPLRDGVISDFDTTEAMLRHFIHKVHQNPSSRWKVPKISRPRVVIGIPSGVTEVERRAVQDVALVAGARQAYLIEEPMADAIGAGLSIEEPEGNMIVDIGGGTTEIAVISLGGMVTSRSLRVAGDEMDQDIINYLKMRYGLLIGEKTAENIKIEIGSAVPLKEEKETVVRGRDLATGLPKSLKISSKEIREAISGTINQIIGTIGEVLEETPPELVGDVLERGVVITGGGALLRGLDKKIAEETKMPVWIADDPLTTVVRGCGRVLEDLDLLSKVKVTGGLR
ncbi:MAG: Rod shape-determining protein mreB [Candidatus Daviesbacteria bacterium GW2011_GWA1_41_61]|uniref:Cell shape-determining protein MreB n=1 Tax=Candidatus Daviesbacteria bacterium GW2011_GWA2_40_9 TaxID=1618424 RepID=A0A0G0WD48_9BACT|nr:MAG: rod shape-determining protein MreB, rod shape-determining protein MreB [Candidatus Daviesbacteria bacterium GW2011_GWC1_40_9]KKR82185.1 MAG: Rod shape-determining protein mreB [Candidatus Daviesbacteria bacterium GW2011_GWA2_40_9]KKR93623.1 MAG: Rod shape-determining protein mreB [Candidatus Daviesbacteria bacterium GW2011_GWB1_41_15]KKS14826.1 MAG: Rod shape-determining protein mreB [Candidatus Daviesbacteria bacterium GW2011_GWA1_41_61]